MPSALSRSVYTLSLTVLLATLLIGEDFSSYLKRDARANLPREALLRRQQDVPAVPGVEERAALDAGCSAENCNFLSYGCDHNQTQPNYVGGLAVQIISIHYLTRCLQYGCACSASYLNAYKLCSSNCSHIPPYSLYRDFCISNGWFNQNTINGTQQNVGGGNGTNNKPGSAWGYPTRGCMTNECRTCIQACDPGVLSYDEVVGFEIAE